MIKAGKIGPLTLGQGSYMRNNPKGEWNYAIDPDAKADNLNWKQWLGPVKHADTKDFNADHYFRWRKYYPYCAGLLGDLFPHRLHPLMLATGNPEFPLRVVSIGNSKLTLLGFKGPYRGTRHEYLLLDSHRQTIPTNSEYSVPQLKFLLRQVEAVLRRRISAEEWENL